MSAQFHLLAVTRYGEALYWADIDACIAFDATRRAEGSLDIAVQAPLNLACGLFGSESELHLDVYLLEALYEINMRHLLTRNRVVLVVVAPFADAHFLAHEIHAVGGAVCYRKTLAILMNRNGSLMSV